MSEKATSFDQIVFSGGGIRCFWHGGWMSTVQHAVPLEPSRVVGVSGGALSAAAWLGQAEKRLFDRMRESFRSQDRNIEWHKIDGEDGLTPHQRIYREVVEAVIDAETEARIADGPAFQVLLARPPRIGGPKLRALIAGFAYEVEKKLLNRPRSRWAGATGMTADLIDARGAARDGLLSRLIHAAATIPPVFRIPDWDGKPAVDGGMIDQAPRPEPDEGRTLFLMTRSYRRMPANTDRETYVIPSRRPAHGKIDFTDPDKVSESWNLGIKDARDWLAQHSPHQT